MLAEDNFLVSESYQLGFHNKCVLWSELLDTILKGMRINH
jgi:hypothetical protein